MPQLSPEAQALQKAREKEWGTYVAVAPILYDGVLAANPGDPVPVSVVEAHGYADDNLVAKVTTKTGQAAIAAVTGQES